MSEDQPTGTPEPKDYFGEDLLKPAGGKAADSTSAAPAAPTAAQTAASDVKGAAGKAVSGAIKGAAAGGLAGAATGALKEGGAALAKTKTGKGVIAGGIAAVCLPMVGVLVAINMLGGASSIITTQSNSDRSVSYTAVAASNFKPEEIAIFNEYGSRYGVAWEILASAHYVQKNTGGSGAGPYKITLDDAGNPVHNGKALNYLSGDKGSYKTSPEALKELRASTEYIARVIRDSNVGTVNNLPYDSLTVGSKITGSSDPKAPHREINQKNADDVADAKRVEEAYIASLKRLPLDGAEDNAKIIFERARQWAMGQSGSAICSILPVASGKWGNPFVAPTTSAFGPRADPLGGPATTHDGQDFAGPPEGTPFYSASDGTVLSAFGTGGPEGNGDGGHGIIIDAGGGVQLWYWHAAPGTTKVRKGDKVVTGQELAGVGTTGHSTGVHLHFQIMENGVAVNPVPFMAARGVKLGVDPIGKVGGDNKAKPGTNWDVSETFTAVDAEGNSITLKKTQLKNAETIISVGRSLGVDDQGILVALITALQESKLLMYANSSAYPESLDFPHDADGSDHDSLGLFQQRPAAGWGSVEELMDATENAKRFYGGPKGPNQGNPPGLLDVMKTRDLSGKTPGEIAQAVQVSAFPDAYEAWVPVGKKIMATVSGTSTPISCLTEGSKEGEGDVTTGLEFDGDVSVARQKIVDFAKQGLGTKYVWGGTSETTGWDCSGYFQWAYTKAGVNGVPRTNQWSAGKKTTSPKPGDLVVMLADKKDASGNAINWSHVGIYAGEQNGERMFYNALNPSEGTKLNKVSAVGGDAEYFNLLED